MRVLIQESPYAKPGQSGANFSTRGAWPCKWVVCPGLGEPPFVTAYRRAFELDRDATIRVHASADERYELFLDGRRIGRGPERGTPDCWFFETYDLSLSKGPHTLVARVWSLGGLAPLAQLSVCSGFLLSPEEPFIDLLGTGRAPWEAKRLDGYEFVGAGMAFGTGAKETIDGAKFPWGYEEGKGDGWLPVAVLDPADENVTGIQFKTRHRMMPAMLPAMMEVERRVGRVRHVSAPATTQSAAIPVRGADNLEGELRRWDLLKGERSVTVPPHTIRRVLYDLENYYCAYPEITVSGGKGGFIRMTWVESLFLSISSGPATNANWWERMPKGNRDEIEGKLVCGVADTFKPDGGARRRFDTLWWRPGRYVELVVQAAGEPLTIDAFRIRETRYPLEMVSEFSCSDERIARVTPIVLRGLQECMHETHMDTPGQEQQFYTADTYLGVRTVYAMAGDDRMGRKALRIFDLSRAPSGLTRATWPTRITFFVPSYSLFWVATVHDFAWWCDDPALVRSVMPGVRAVIDAVLAYRNKDGIIDTNMWWNWLDWVPGWPGAEPPASKGGPSAIVNWQFVWTLRQAASLEEYVGEPEMAARARRLAHEIGRRLVEKFWDERRNLFADDPAKTGFYEHTQALALLSGGLEPPLAQKLADALFSQTDLTSTTIYFSHYLFEACAQFDRMDVFWDRMRLWFDLEKEGLKTPYEMPVIPTRADCLGWGGYPIYHYFATILGIRPGSHGFRTVEIAPHLGPLRWAKGSMVHPKGRIEVDLRAAGVALKGTITLPKGLAGRFRHAGRTQTLHEGTQKIQSAE